MASAALDCHAAAQAIASFAACVFEPDDIVEVRLLPSTKSTWHKAAELPSQAARLAAFNAKGENVYVGANARKRKGGKAAEDVVLARCLFADFDNGTDEAEARRRWKAGGMPEPTLLLHSGHGIHPYWRLAEPILDLAKWTALQKSLIAALGSDPAIHDPPRIMRSVGFQNCKREPWVAARLIDCDPSRRYALEELPIEPANLPNVRENDDLAEAYRQASEGQPKRDEPPAKSNGKRPSVAERAALYVEKLEPSIAGQRGHDRLFHVACVLKIGFELTDAESLPILRKYNERAVPEWPEAELSRKLKEADKQPGIRGELRDADNPNWKPTPGKNHSSQRQAAPAIEPYRPFPVGSLPEPAKGFTIAAAKAIGCDPSYIALPLLTAAAAAIGTTRRIRLKNSWTEPAVIWSAIVGSSGTLKSPAIDAPLKTVRRMQARALAEYDEACRRYDEDKAEYDAEYKTWQGKGRRAGELRPEAPKEPICQRYWCEDTTIEALADRLQHAPRGLLNVRDELSAFFQGRDQYKSGGKGSDTGHFLTMHGARHLCVDRKGQQRRRPIYVPMAAVSIVGGIQPEVLARSLGRVDFENGLAARFLLAMPPPPRKKWTEADINPAVDRDLANVVENLLTLEHRVDEDGNPAPIDVPLSPEAKRSWIVFYDEHAAEQEGLTGDMAAAWSKLEGYAARLALVVHSIRWAARDPALESADYIDATSIDMGVTLARWFAGEARRVYGVLTESDEDRDTRKLLEWITKAGGAVTARDLQRGYWALRNPGAAEAALNELAKTGIGTWQPSEPGEPGQPTRRFCLATFDGTPPKREENRDTVDVEEIVEAENEVAEWSA